MFMKYNIVFLLSSLWLYVIPIQAKDSPAAFVNPFIGTSNGGNTHPGAVRPFGMMSVVPDNSYNPEEDKRIFHLAYAYGNKSFSGFVHANLSGTGCPDLGAFTIMPVSGNLKITPKRYACSYTNEKAEAGYYCVELPEQGVLAEASATLRTGIERFTFHKGEAHLLVDIGKAITEVPGGSVKINSSTEVEGYKMIGDFCGTGKQGVIYFVAQFDKPAMTFGCWNREGIQQSYTQEDSGDNVGAFFSYQMEEGEQLCVKIGISYVSIENAQINLEQEQTGFRFDEVRQAAYDDWNDKLARIQVEGGNERYKQMFYTGLYHVLIHPNILNDVNGDYPAYITREKKNVKGRNRYTIFSLWDTYRNVHPLLSLVYPEYQSEMVKSLLDMYNEAGRLPKWELCGMETNVMVGDPAVIVIADTYLRGIRDFDVNLAYKAMMANAMASIGDMYNEVRPGYDEYMKKGYIAELPEGENREGPWLWGSVSTGLEYCMSDFSIAQMALALNKKNDYQTFYRYSKFYRNYYDPSIGFMRPRLVNGNWFEPFNKDPEGDEWWSQTGFVEGCTWHYSLFVPFDIPGLIELNGGEQAFISKLKDCFENGYFNMENEPDIAYPYLFNYVKGEEEHTQYWVRKCLNTYFGNDHNGITGNDDCGTMSAWLVYSMMGFYPDCPAKDTYQLTNPLFDKVTIKLHPAYYKGRIFVINAGKNACDKQFIKEMRMNGKVHKSYVITHQQIIDGGNLMFTLK